MKVLLVRLLQWSVGGVVIGVMAVTLTIAFAALIYTGPLAQYLGEGANFALLGAAIMALVGTFAYSIRGAIANPQDSTAVVLGSAAIGIAASGSVPPDALFPTVLALTVAACLVAGASVFLAGILRLGAMVRYTPYPVTAGFLAATGYLLVMGAMSIVTRESVTLFNLFNVIGSAPLFHWLPWIAAGLALAIIANRVPGDFTLPAALGLAALGFFGFLAIRGISLDTALAQGLLLGPFHETDPAGAHSWQLIQRIHWTEVVGAAPALAAVAGLALLGSLLNTTGLAIIFQLKTDTDRDMRATGLANLASAPLGGLPGYIILGESILARRMGISGHAPGLFAAVACAAAAIVGTEYVAYAPAGLMAMVVAYLGFDLLGTWVLSSRRRLSQYEHAIVLFIVLVTATFGFLEALALGTLTAAAIFVFAYAKTDVVRARSTLAFRRSWMERSDEDVRQLSQVGHACVVLELSGFLFFGTADKVARQASAELGSDSDLRFLIFDFGRVTGLDASASVSLVEIVRASREAGVEMSFCGMSPELEHQLRLAMPRQQDLRFNGTIYAELERIEDLLLTESCMTRPAPTPRLLRVVQCLEEDFAGCQDIIRRVSLQAGQELLEIGAASTELYVVSGGQLRAEVPSDGGSRQIVAKFRTGALIGEVAHYAGEPRTAWIVAETASEVIRVDLGEMEPSRSASLLEFHKASAEAMARRIMRMTEYNRRADPGKG
ncbi:SulP family inorganic anion transporter [Tropicimonas sp. IMCC6043]|uniref:SulP family inorganic anion transporter n=1 Tax=Tropicimonas sp. IMCC6043 TaxID=2510645 RepID=UPI00101D8936|nr:SulP family inorganic anion transporter [Tropicimonas sp. IMCC6043]RYH06886.1 cyclic nucleotide-binding domain-containing protein [Tropicimonas sp. IMCC6043]